MRLRCKLGFHAAPNPYLAIRTDNIWFGECPFCLTEIIKPGKKSWRTTPHGYRIAWVHNTAGGHWNSTPTLVKIER